jgi:SAM-dependent methyltransferase
MTQDKLERFTERYQSGEIPWDTGITPPEIVAITAELPAGKVLDLGCGTGTNVGYMLQHGWVADGIDFVPRAIEIAQEKLAAFPADSFGVYCHDVTQLESCAGLRPPYDLIIDIGCGHGVDPDKQDKYARDVTGLLREGGIYMLYAHEPTEKRGFGWTPADVQRIFTPYLKLTWQVLSNDTSIGDASGWYRLEKITST